MHLKVQVDNEHLMAPGLTLLLPDHLSIDGIAASHSCPHLALAGIFAVIAGDIAVVEAAVLHNYPDALAAAPVEDMVGGQAELESDIDIACLLHNLETKRLQQEKRAVASASLVAQCLN